MENDDIVAAERLYAAMRAKNPRAILAALDQDLVGDVSAVTRLRRTAQARFVARSSRDASPPRSDSASA